MINVIRNILNWLYEDANIKMERKYNKYLELIEENKRVELDQRWPIERISIISLKTVPEGKLYAPAKIEIY